ncbi:hypothetical protein [Lactobacillus sp. PSON]|uniref:hypothetical protein n=1 Tax=Lactobacillus sp. PSON TaxID=3455454 RepID=UPI0040425A3B
MIEDFREWSDTTLTSFDEWKQKFIDEALSKGTYKKALNWLSSQEIDLLGRSASTVQDHFNYAVRQMIEDAKKEVRDKALNKEI